MDQLPLTLTTDFGWASRYVGQMKGSILSINGAANLVDVSHTVPAYNLTFASLLVRDVSLCYPPGSLHLIVVDPGVGSQRRMLAVETDTQRYVAPDNGVLSHVIAAAGALRVFQLENPKYWRKGASATFHGRDIMGPVAAHWSLGIDPTEFGSPVADDLVSVAFPQIRREDQRILGEVIGVDDFGNLITNIHEGHLPEDLRHSARIRIGEATIAGLVRYYGQCPPGELLALVGSSGHLEISVCQGSAADLLAVETGTLVVVEPA